MNCANAQQVWGHPKGFIAGLSCVYPGVLEKIEGITEALLNGNTNPFHNRVKEKIGPTSVPFYVEHSDDADPLSGQIHEVVGDAAGCLMLERHLKEKFGADVRLRNICCDGCEASLGCLSADDQIAIQNASIRTAPDGSDIDISAKYYPVST